MNRILAIVGAVAFTAAQSSTALAAHPGGFAPLRPIAPIAQPVFKAPTHIDAQTRLSVPLRFGFPLQPSWPMHRWYGWQSNYPWYPTLLNTACPAADAFAGPANGFAGSANEQPFETTLGDLVDGKSTMLQSPSYTNFAAGGNAAPAATPALTFQSGFYSNGFSAAPC